MGDTDLPTISPSNSHKDFDLESYISSYSSHTKIQRLLFISNQSPEHCIEAYKLCLEELKVSGGQNTHWYREILKACKEKGIHLDKVLRTPSESGDREKEEEKWMEEVDKRAKKQLERLESELANAKTNLIKESIRLGYLDLGAFHYERGDLTSSLKNYLRTRDYCTTSKHILHMCMKVLVVSVLSGNWGHVVNFGGKAEQALETYHSNETSGSNQASTQTSTGTVTPSSSSNSESLLIAAKLKCFSGLANLEAKKYKMAAKKFLETTFDIYNNFSDVMSANDVAVYGGLCALATFERTELKKRVLDNQHFKQFLELVPEIRELLYTFYNSQYSSCLQLLNKLKNDLQLDYYLHSHINLLWDKIRNKAIIQYFSPFISVDLKVMAQNFQTSIDSLEREIESLILSKQIQARIDSQNKILYARQTDQRSTTYQKVLKLGDDYQKNTKAMLVRLNMLRNAPDLSHPQQRIYEQMEDRLD